MSDRIGLLAVGGGPAGLAAARSYRGAGGTGRVAILTDEHRLPYNRPPLTKELLRGDGDEADLPIEAPAWFDEHGIELISGRAVALDPAERTATLSGGRTIPYQQCVLATGAEPVRVPVPGSDHDRVRVIRTLDHLRELLRRLGERSHVAVIGSGFIGCEIASSLRQRGHRVTLVSDEAAPNATRLGDDAGAILAGWLAADGVELVLGAAVTGIEPGHPGLTVRGGERLVAADLVVMAAGVSPRVELAHQARVRVEDGAIAVSSAMRTERSGLFAAGDACRADNAAAGRPLRVEHWGDAIGQGAVAGAVAAGEDVSWSAVPGFWSTIGRRTLKYAAWGDGFDTVRIERHADGGFTVWYGAEGRLVGVLTHEADAEYEAGQEQIGAGARWS